VSVKTSTTNWHEFITPTEELLEEARRGKMFILVDDEDRENEGTSSSPPNSRPLTPSISWPASPAGSSAWP
jgi:hypothetical protein